MVPRVARCAGARRAGSPPDVRWLSECSRERISPISREEIVKVYYDYAKGAGNGALLTGRHRSSFVFEPDWRARPWPPKDKYGHSATDAELGL